MATLTLTEFTDATSTDARATQLAGQLRQADPMTWRRAKLVPLAVGLVILMLVQEGFLQMFAIPTDAKDWMDRLGIPAELAPLIGVLALGVLIWKSWSVLQKVHQRVKSTGLEDA